MPSCYPAIFLARYGGEEFAAILTGTLASDAEQSLEAMRTSTVGPVTVSIGHADHVDTREATETVERADVALHSAKAAGRDRVVNARTCEILPAANWSPMAVIQCSWAGRCGAG